MSSQGGLGGGGGGGSRASIPENAKRMIQSIREITGKQHSDEEIFAVLQECFMDPNETAQKLLYLDTFHEVKRKRDKKKEATGVQGRGGRGSRANYFTSSSKDAGVARNSSARRDNWVNHTSDRGSAPLPVYQKVENNAASRTKKTTTSIPNGTTTLPNGSSSYGSQLSVNDVNGEAKDGLPANKPATISVQPDVAEPPACIPAPLFVSLIQGQEKSVSNSNGSSSSSSSATVSGVYPSASDPVFVPTVSQHAGAAGTIKCEIGRQHEATEINNIQGNKHVPDDIDVSKTEKTAFEVPVSMHGNKSPSKSEAAEQVKESNLMESTSLQVVTSEVASLTVKDISQYIADSKVPNGQHVTFPTHFQVSENGLTFGSFDTSFGLGTENNISRAEISSACPVETSLSSDELAGEPSSRSQGILSAAEGDNADQPRSPPELEEVPKPEGNVPSVAELNDQSTQEVHLHPEGNPPIIPNAPSYGFGLTPASAGHLSQFDGPEAWVHDVSRLANFAGGNTPVPSGTSTPPLQSSVGAAPQAVHLFRQPFPPNYFPYPHYLPPFYMHAMHQYLTLAGLPQQPSTGNVYVPPGAAAPGVKFPLSQFKPGTNAGNPAHFANPSGYGPLTPPPVGFNLSVPSVTSGSSSSKEDLAASQLKENHIYTTGPLNEGSAIWMTASPAQDLSSLLYNPLYPLHGPQLPFSPAQASHGAIAGLYQPSQTIAPPSNTNNLLQQSQATETAIPASGAYQQSQLAQLNWNTNY
ncbi:GBF-interacting protein 1-like isoform X2 [Gossypium raimondii]|uniref:GBF-interacting protein 1 N-terminal domain-containing protein n=2 Tax=Gossypium raimondii TaxID=29730 RepID=A0A0D2U504_GOSRA|nr:GBF-interacting protein 1-like isoform X2 [Gossypium raimondii]KJB63041.1 hypothetical protein B456_009G451000 [Gossypium raimondii]